MVRIERGNVVLKVQEHEVQRYLTLGYNVTDDEGNIIKGAIPNDLGTLQRFYVEHKKRIDELESIVAKLTAENEVLAESAKPKTSKKPETTK